MTRKEFIREVERIDNDRKVELSENEWRAIETVYNWHPSIDESEGKSQIASLYVYFGMRIIYDMLPTAEKYITLDNELRDIQRNLNKIQEQLNTAKEEYLKVLYRGDDK